MPIITLTSDWGLKDYYLAAVKGSIISQCPEAKIIDITHFIPLFDYIQAAYVIKNSYKYFPKGSIHIIGINTIASIENPHICVLYDGHYFIGSDNGIFSLIMEEAPEKIIELDIHQDSDYFTFSTKDIFAKVACQIAKGKKIEELGIVKDTIISKNELKPIVDKDSIIGMVIYTDVYENIITNISENLFKKVQKGRNFEIKFRSYSISKIHKAYDGVGESQKLALFSSNGLLEIAICKGKAKSLLGLEYGDSIVINFY